MVLEHKSNRLLFVNHKTVILTLASVITWSGTSDVIVTDVH